MKEALKKIKSKRLSNGIPYNVPENWDFKNQSQEQPKEAIQDAELEKLAEDYAKKEEYGYTMQPHIIPAFIAGWKAKEAALLSQPKEAKQYLKSEYDLQIIKMKSLGIDTESQTFEQCVNAVIYMAGGKIESEAVEFAEWLELEGYHIKGMDNGQRQAIYKLFKNKQ